MEAQRPFAAGTMSSWESESYSPVEDPGSASSFEATASAGFVDTMRAAFLDEMKDSEVWDGVDATKPALFSEWAAGAQLAIEPGPRIPRYSRADEERTMRRAASGDRACGSD